MTWAEFRIRLHAYRRQEENDIYKLRELAWITYMAPHLDTKKMKKSKEAFWPIGGKKNSQATDLMRKRMKEAQEMYKREKESKKNLLNSN